MSCFVFPRPGWIDFLDYYRAAVIRPGNEKANDRANLSPREPDTSCAGRPLKPWLLLGRFYETVKGNKPSAERNAIYQGILEDARRDIPAVLTSKALEHGVFGVTHGRSYSARLRCPDLALTASTSWLIAG